MRAGGNLFFTRKFKLLFSLYGKYDPHRQEFIEIPAEGDLDCSFEIYKILFTSSEPVGPTFKAQGKFSILLEVLNDATLELEINGDEVTCWEPLKSITACCTTTGNEIYFDHCSMGDWKIDYVYLSDAMLKKHLTSINEKIQVNPILSIRGRPSINELPNAK